MGDKNYTEDVHICPRFDYNDFYDSGFLSDVKLKIKNGPEINAHIIVLANSSRFFYSMFTGDMQEARKHYAELKHNPGNLLTRVIRYMYTGKIQWDFEETMSLYSIARFYQIDSLLHHIQQQLEKIVTAQNVMQLVDQCFQEHLLDELRYIERFVVKYYQELKLEDLSDQLDVLTFANILSSPELPKKFTSQELVETITNFLVDYEFEKDEEREALLKVLRTKGDSGLKDAITNLKPYWVPQEFINSLN